jgi:hypothetical protein
MMEPNNWSVDPWKETRATIRTHDPSDWECWFPRIFEICSRSDGEPDVGGEQGTGMLELGRGSVETRNPKTATQTLGWPAKQGAKTQQKKGR